VAGTSNAISLLESSDIYQTGSATAVTFRLQSATCVADRPVVGSDDAQVDICTACMQYDTCHFKFNELIESRLTKITITVYTDYAAKLYTYKI